jgi:hypothetical protein
VMVTQMAKKQMVHPMNMLNNLPRLEHQTKCKKKVMKGMLMHC